MVTRDESVAGTPAQMDRVFAWHVLTALGDSLWWAEAGLDLTLDGSQPGRVDELAARLDAGGVGAPT